MSLCPKCAIGGVLQGFSSFSYAESADSADAPQVGMQLAYSLETDDAASSGERTVSFEGTVTEGTLEDGIIEGTLSGQFDVITENEISAPARIRTFASRGQLAFLTIEVEDETGRPFFTANLRPATPHVDPAVAVRDIRGIVFLAWDDPSRAEGRNS